MKQKNIYDLRLNTSAASGVMYVVRLLNEKTGKSDFFDYLLGISKPCLRCETCMYKHRVKKIKYTDIIEGVNVLCELRIEN